MKHFKEGLLFTVTPKTEYEKLPFEGNYKIVHVGDFDGERYSTTEYCPVVQCIKFDSTYTIEKNIHKFEKQELGKLFNAGYLKFVDFTKK